MWRLQEGVWDSQRSQQQGTSGSAPNSGSNRKSSALEDSAKESICPAELETMERVCSRAENLRICCLLPPRDHLLIQKPLSLILQVPQPSHQGYAPMLKVWILAVSCFPKITYISRIIFTHLARSATLPCSSPRLGGVSQFLALLESA